MKISLSSFFLIISIHTFCQIPNSSFEEWNELESFSHPEVEDANFSSVNNGIFYSNDTLGLTQIEGSEGLGVRVQTLLLESDTIIGYGIYGSIPGGGAQIFENGFEFNEQNIDTLSFDVRYDINEEDPGVVFVQFLNQGNPVTFGEEQDSSMFYMISGTELEWQTIHLDFSLIPLNDIPDECVIGFASNDFRQGIGSPGNFLEVDNIDFRNLDFHVPGGDFENWIEVPGPLELIDWQGFFSPNSGFVFQSDQSIEGEYSVGLMSQLSDTTLIQSAVFLGESSNFGIVPNQVLPENAFSLEFSYSLISETPDSARIQIMLSEDDDPETFDVVYINEVLPQTDGWEEVNINFSGINSNANFYGIQFFSGPAYPAIGSDSTVLLIDDMKFIELGGCDFNVDLELSADTLCPGETLSISAAEYDSYSWFLSENGIDYFEVSEAPTFESLEVTSGEYYAFLLAENSNCFQLSDTLSFLVNELEIPEISSAGFENLEVCPNENILIGLENSSEFSAVQWYLDSMLISGEILDSLEIESIEGFTGEFYLEAIWDECPLSSILTNSVIINTFELPVIEINIDGNSLSTGNFPSYQWFLNGDEILGGFSQTISAQEAGEYSVEITDENGCTYLSEEVFFEDFEDSVLENEIHITAFPNPVSEVLYISSDNEIFFISLFDSSGRLVSEFSTLEQDEINFSELENGIYFLSWVNSRNNFNLRIVKEN